MNIYFEHYVTIYFFNNSRYFIFYLECNGTCLGWTRHIALSSFGLSLSECFFLPTKIR